MAEQNQAALTHQTNQGFLNQERTSWPSDAVLAFNNNYNFFLIRKYLNSDFQRGKYFE